MIKHFKKTYVSVCLSFLIISVSTLPNLVKVVALLLSLWICCYMGDLYIKELNSIKPKIIRIARDNFINTRNLYFDNKVKHNKLKEADKLFNFVKKSISISKLRNLEKEIEDFTLLLPKNEIEDDFIQVKFGKIIDLNQFKKRKKQLQENLEQANN